MARPTVIHDGFLVPNAAEVSHPRMAEPDQLDFSTAGNHRWGVVDGCLVTVSGTTASTLGGVAVVNGVMVSVPSSTAQLGVGGAQDRFDLLVATLSGDFKVIVGTPSVDPVFPDVPLDCTVLATVFAPTGASGYDSNVIDKRRFVSKSLLTQLGAGEILIRNLNGSGDRYRVLGDGKMEWTEDGTRMFRSAAKTLRIEDHLQVVGNAVLGGSLQARNLVATNLVSGLNLTQGSSPPAPGDVPLGALYQATTGRLYLNTTGGWKELVTSDSAVPVGAVLSSVEPPAVMGPLGWVALAGQNVSESTYPSLFTLTAFTGLHQGVAPNRTMVLPDARQRVLMGSAAGVGTVGGALNNQVVLRTDQMPRHKHGVAVQPGGGAAPTGRVGRSGVHAHVVPATSGVHGHAVSDPGHSHAGGAYPAGAFLCLMWGGQNKIDALFNDRNHTYSVEAVDWARPATTGIEILTTGSGHGHQMDPAGDHDHPLAMDPIPAHPHAVTENEVGTGASIDITPAFIAFYVYIRS